MSDLAERIAARRKQLEAAKGDHSSIGARIAARRAELAKEQPQQIPQETLDRVAAADQIAEDRMVNQSRSKLAADKLDPVTKGFAQFARGLPFVGEYVDEVADALMPATADKPSGGAILRRANADFERQNPKTATGLQVAGGIAGAVPLAVGGAGLVAKAPGIAPKVGGAAIMGGAGGALEGAARGYGRGETPEQRKDLAKQDALIGGGVGVAAGALAPIIGKSAKEIYRRVSGLDVKTIVREFGISPKAATVVKQALKAGDLDTVTKNLDLDGAMLADANQATGQLLDAASATGGRALQITRDAVDGRANAAGVKLNSAFDRILGKPQGVKTTAKAIAKKSSGVRQRAYDLAYSKPIDYSKAGRNVEEVLSRIPPKTLKGAIDEANEAMTAAGVKNAQIMAEIGDDGAVLFREMPNVQQLDEVKKALGEIGRREVDQFGRPTAKGMRATKLAGELRDAVSGAVPDYKRAVKLGGDKIAEDQAFDIGRGIFLARTKVEDVAEAVKGASKDQKAAMAQGVRENIEDILSGVKRTITDPNTDAREAMQAVKEISSRASRRKLRLALGSKASKELLREIDTATAALELRAMVATNSKTAVRQAVQDQVENVTAPGIVSRAASGEVVQSGKQVVQALTGATAEMRTEQKQQIFAEIAEALTSIRGPKAARAMQYVEKAMAGQPLKEAQANYVAKLIGGGFAGTSYQAGTQALGQP